MPNNNMVAYVALDNGPKETSNETTIIAIIAHSPLESLSTNSHTAQRMELLGQAKDSAIAQGRVEDGQRPANVSHPSTSRVVMAVEWVKHMTIFKALLIIYCLNVVAWGGMIFLLLCNAAPAMCHPTCDDINSPRRKLIEIDSQILNALFCVPAFGHAPRRFTEGWQLLRYLSGQDLDALRRLAATYRGWFRLLGSQTVPSDIGPSGDESWLCQNPTLKDVVPHPSQSILEAPSFRETSNTYSIMETTDCNWLERDEYGVSSSPVWIHVGLQPTYTTKLVRWVISLFGFCSFDSCWRGEVY